jgi:DNA polymerase I-like protein with 3'-5' exonuclease and polymerase domains
LGKASSIAKSRGYVQTIGGRHIRFPGGKFTHKAAGLVFQGSSADCMKQKMVELHESSKGQDWSLRLSVHDECDFYFPKGESERLTTHVKEVLECFDGERSPIKCRVPILSSVTCADNWWEASK